MAAVKFFSDFWAQENKICHCFHYFALYLPWSDGTWCQNLNLLNVEFQASFSSHSTLSRSSRDSSVPLLLLPLDRYSLHIWGFWYLSMKSWFQFVNHPARNFMIYSVCFQGKPFNITVIQVYALTSNAEEADVEHFYEDLQDLLKLTPKKDVIFITGAWNVKRKKSRNTWSNRQVRPWSTEWSRAKANGVVPREGTGYSKHPLPKTQEKALHMDIIRWSILKSDWLYSFQPKMEKLYTVSKNKTRG